MQAVVGLGGSAGSIGPLKAFFSRMPVDSGLAFVVVLHLSLEHESSLVALLRNVTPMRVVQVSEAVTAEANCVYLIQQGGTAFPGKASLRRSTRFLGAAVCQSRRFPLSSNPPIVLARGFNLRRQLARGFWPPGGTYQHTLGVYSFPVAQKALFTEF